MAGLAWLATAGQAKLGPLLNLIDTPRTMTKKLFKKGFASGEAIKAALALPAGHDRQAAIDNLERLGPRKLVSPSAGALAELPPEIALLRPPEDDSIDMAADIAELGALAVCRDLQPDQFPPEIINELRRFPGHEMAFGDPFQLPGDPIPGFGTVFGRHHVNLGWNQHNPWWIQIRDGSYGGTAATHAAIQRGAIPQPQQFRRILQSWSLPPTLRGLASMAHQDQPYLPGLFIAFQLSAAQVPLSSRFPALPNETGFVSHGGLVDIHCAIAEATRLAMQWTWALKARECAARPEELWPDAAAGKLHPDILAKAPLIMSRVGPYLPMTFAEGAPLHSTFPSGHASILSACATVLCAMFKDGRVPALGIENLHDEIRHGLWIMQGIGRMAAGLHFRSDMLYGIGVGEAAALHVLRARKQAEPLGQTTFTGFFGREIVI